MHIGSPGSEYRPAAHFSGAPSYSLRIAMQGKVFVYSGDTEWTDTLIEASDQADLFVCESYQLDKAVALHLNYRTSWSTSQS